MRSQSFVLERHWLGSVHDCWDLPRDIQGLPQVDLSEFVAFDRFITWCLQEPKPEQIRPYPILRQTLVELKKRWREKTSYNWICNQFKSLRQDLTVCCYPRELLVEIHFLPGTTDKERVYRGGIWATRPYGSGARTQYTIRVCRCSSFPLPYRMTWWSTLNVKQPSKYYTTLAFLGKWRSLLPIESLCCCTVVILAVRLLLRSDINTVTRLFALELNLYVGQLTPKQKADSSVQHALGVQRSMAMGNYHRMFVLYMNAPNMGAYIMDHFIDRERVKALMVMAKAWVSCLLIAGERLLSNFIQLQNNTHFLHP